MFGARSVPLVWKTDWGGQQDRTSSFVVQSTKNTINTSRILRRLHGLFCVGAKPFRAYDSLFQTRFCGNESTTPSTVCKSSALNYLLMWRSTHFKGPWVFSLMCELPRTRACGSGLLLYSPSFSCRYSSWLDCKPLSAVYPTQIYLYCLLCCRWMREEHLSMI